MTYDVKILLGQITKAYGHNGFVIIRPEKFADDFFRKKQESVFLEIEGEPVPFFIEEAESYGSNLWKVKFLYYESLNSIEDFIGCRVFLPPDSVHGDHFNVFLLKGYTLYTQNNEMAGKIMNVIENVSQYLIAVNTVDDKEILIPLHEDLIEKVDTENRILILNVPEGLVDIFD